MPRIGHVAMKLNAAVIHFSYRVGVIDVEVFYGTVLYCSAQIYPGTSILTSIHPRAFGTVSTKRLDRSDPSMATCCSQGDAAKSTPNSEVFNVSLSMWS